MAERRDLTELEFYFGSELSSGLAERNIRRVVEVGVGSIGFGMDLNAIQQLVHLDQEGQPLFRRDDVLGIDPALPDEASLANYAPASLLQKFRLQRLGLDRLARAVESRAEKPFDLVLCKGVLSVGLLYAQHGDIPKTRTSARGLLRDLTTILNRRNPDSLLIVSDVLPDTVLPVSDQDFQQRGLRVAHGKNPSGRGGSWAKHLRKASLSSEGEKFYSIVIAQPQPR